MAETVIVTEGDGQGASPDFAAGVAAATAVAAAQTAQEAEGRSELALDVATEAVGQVDQVAGTAFDAQVTAEMALEAVADLEERVFAAFGDLAAVVVEEIVEETAPPADAVVSGDGNTVEVTTDDKPKPKPKAKRPFWQTRL